jgi:phosphate-selective porin
MKKILAATALLALALATGVMAQDERDSTDLAVDSLRQAMQETKDRLDGMNENLLTLNSDVNILKWVKVSGYLQTRWEYMDSLANFASGPDTRQNNGASNIYIRRGRVKFTVTPNTTSKYVFYLDASKNTVSLKEAYAELSKTVNFHTVALTVGQFNWPFGYEIEYSSSQRDFPERSAAENALFKGERDRGINVTYTAPKYFSANIGIFNGYGIDDKNYSWWDPTKQKDIIARAKVKLGMLDVGVSGYWGEYFQPGTVAVAASTSWTDTDGDHVVDPTEVTNTDEKEAVPGFSKDKNRYGADAQLYLDLLPIGATAVRGEYFWGEDFDKKGGPDLLVSRQGWYLWVSQAISTKFGAAIRYDYWDPNSDESAINDAVGTLSTALHYYWDANVRITAAYDMPGKLKGQSTFSKITNDPEDNRFTMQFQFMF